MPQNDKHSMQRLRTASETAKIALSGSTKQTFVEAMINNHYFTTMLMQAKFNELCNDLFLSTLSTIDDVLIEGEFQKEDIEEIILVGGSSRIPKMQEILQQHFSGKILNKSINADQAGKFYLSPNQYSNFIAHKF